MTMFERYRIQSGGVVCGNVQRQSPFFLPTNRTSRKIPATQTTTHSGSHMGWSFPKRFQNQIRFTERDLRWLSDPEEAKLFGFNRLLLLLLGAECWLVVEKRWNRILPRLTIMSSVVYEITFVFTDDIRPGDGGAGGEALSFLEKLVHTHSPGRWGVGRRFD